MQSHEDEIRAVVNGLIDDALAAGTVDAIDALGKKIEAASGDQQLFMTDLQSLMGKASDASSTMSNILKRLHDNNEAIIRNL